MKKIMITVSGGRSSAMMARHIQTSAKYKNFEKLYVFANTGQERKETIDFLKNIEKHWNMPIVKVEGVYSLEIGVGVGYKIVEWDELKMDSSPFTEMIAHKNKGVYEGLPHSEAPYCSENLKTTPCHKLAKDVFGDLNFIKAIGYRKEDMPKRISWAEIKEDKKRIFPLITDFENPISQFDLNIWWERQPFKLAIHGELGNCDLCWKKSEKTLLKNIRYGANSVEWWRKMEKKYNDTSFRGKLSIDDLIKLAEEPFTHELKFTENEDDDFNCVCNF